MSHTRGIEPLLRAGDGFELAKVDTASTPGFDGGKKEGVSSLAAGAAQLAELQEMLYANGLSGDRRRILLVLQAMDTAGKGGIVGHVVGAVNPYGVHIAQFKAPTDEEKAHDFLWRIRKQLPTAGMLGVFDRSHYEDVIVHRVRHFSTPEVIDARYGEIVDFENELRAGGTTVVNPDGSTTTTGGGGRTVTTYRASIGASWEPDIWGRIRRGIEGARGQAQASQADLAAATLSAQGSLAADYFGLRGADAQIALLTQAVAGYQKSLQIAQNRFNAGIAPHSDVLQAQSQLASTQADLADLTRTRAAFEHAIAVLAGQTPESFAIAADPTWQATIPQVPAGVPSTLLQRRPDVAAAERRAAAASAQIGVQTAAYFPDLTLTGSYGFAATELGKLFSASNSVWSFGASAAETLFNGGLTRARVAAARAAYDEAVAQYRQTSLAALQDVEDQLAASRVLAEEHALRLTAADAADRAAVMVLNQYREGQVDYTSVVTAQVQALNARRTLVQSATTRESTAVALIQAIGGGWARPF